MAIVAEILLPDDTLPLVDLANSIPSGEIAVENFLPLEGGQHLVTVSVDDDSREVFDRELDAQPGITDAAGIGRTADGWFYRMTVGVDSELIASHDPEQFEGVVLDRAVTGDGLRELKVFSDYEAFSTLRDRCETHDIPFELLNIASDPENPDERDRFGLTDRQFTALSLAFSRGYYDSPRRTSTQDLADELGIAAASASDLLRRAEHQLISGTLGPTKHLKGLIS